MIYKVELSRGAERTFEKLPRGIQRRVQKKIEALATDPRPGGVEKLAGGEGALRVRVGDYRIIYEVRDKVLVVLVLVIGHRSSVYR